MQFNPRIILFVLLLILGAVFVIFHFVAPRIISQIEFPGSSGRLIAQTDFIQNKIYGIEKVEIQSEDGLKMLANHAQIKKGDSKGTVVLLHGIRSGKECFLEIQELLAKNGYNSLAIDLRAHGESEGKYCTFGEKEKNDVKIFVDYLLKMNGSQSIGMWAHSLGGAIALQCLANDERIKFGVIESTFSDFELVCRSYFKLNTGFGNQFLSDYLAKRAAEIAGFNSKTIAPKYACEKIHQPIFLSHGNADKRIDKSHTEENFKRLSSTQKTLIEIEGAGHVDLWSKGGNAYFKEVIEFIDAHSTTMSFNTNS